MIIVKNSQLNNETVTALNNLIDMDINAKIAFKLMRIIKEVSSLVDDKISMEKRIFDKYLERDESGNPVQVRDESGNLIDGAYKISNMSEFNEEMSNLMSVENNLSYDVINFDDMNLETAKVKDLLKLDFLFS